MKNLKLEKTITKEYSSVIVSEGNKYYGIKNEYARSFMIFCKTDNDLETISKYLNNKNIENNLFGDCGYNDIGYVEVYQSNFSWEVKEFKKMFNEMYKQMKKDLK